METLFLFMLTSLSINIIPGPDVIYVVSNSMSGKKGKGIYAALGLSAGYIIHTIAAVLGLSALIMSSSILFMIIKYLGAAYLLFLGISSLKNAAKGKSKINLKPSAGESSPRKTFSQGLIVSLFNPKVALFFLSFLPQFVVKSEVSVSAQLFFYGGVFAVLASVCNILYALLGKVIFNNSKIKRFSEILEGVSGVILIGLGVKVALSKD